MLSYDMESKHVLKCYTGNMQNTVTLQVLIMVIWRKLYIQILTDFYISV